MVWNNNTFIGTYTYIHTYIDAYVLVHIWHVLKSFTFNSGKTEKIKRKKKYKKKLKSNQGIYTAKENQRLNHTLGIVSFVPLPQW